MKFQREIRCIHLFYLFFMLTTTDIEHECNYTASLRVAQTMVYRLVLAKWIFNIYFNHRIYTQFIFIIIIMMNTKQTSKNNWKIFISLFVADSNSQQPHTQQLKCSGGGAGNKFIK